MYMYIYIQILICTYISTYECAHVWMYACARSMHFSVRACACLCMSACACSLDVCHHECMCMCECMYVHTCVRVDSMCACASRRVRMPWCAHAHRRLHPRSAATIPSCMRVRVDIKVHACMDGSVCTGVHRYTCICINI
jgi:hypothetical protein